MGKRSIQALLAAGIIGGAALTAGNAWAAHNHFIETPNGRCHQLAHGQTSIGDPDHGGYHRYHDNVHQGGRKVLGGGNSQVVVQKDGCP
ncbi:MAG: hypothetical protein M3404_12675 [Actinomycetota bacterium]|nr:hypothetical protein [Actinomycetota bacterium]